MIDFHSHIIPNIDDGAKNVEQTFNMLREAAEAGFDGVVATSHYMENCYESPSEERKVWLDAISQGLEKDNVNINLYLGSEVYFSKDILHLIETKRVSTINNSRYILFEFPMNTKPMGIDDVIFSLLEHKYIPILAHPERYTFVQENPNIICSLIEKGVLMQSNYGSILGQYGSKAQIVLEKMLKNNLVNFLGSDAHRDKSIYTKIDKASSKIKDIIGKKAFDEITHYNPIKVIKNEVIEIESFPTSIKYTITDKIKMGL